MSTPSPQAQAAEWYADHMGWPVIPLHTAESGRCSCGNGSCESAGKHPRTEHGLNDASANIADVARWWRQWPNANIGIRTGTVSGIVVVDIDVKDGRDGNIALEALERQHGTLPNTVEAITGSGGRHLLFQHPGGKIGNRGDVLPGIDIRGDGGYIVAAPSVHASGRIYEYEASGGPRDIALAPLPAWFLQVIQRTNGNGKPRAEPVADTIPQGGRNAALASLAGSMRRRGMEEAEILAALRVTNSTRCAPPLPDEEVARIARSVSRYEPGNSTTATDPGEGSPEPHETPTDTDTGNADRLVAMHGERLRHIASWAKWLVFDHDFGCWKLDHRDVGVRELAKDVGHALKASAAREPDADRAKKMFAFGLRSLSAHGISGMVDLARGIPAVPLDHEDLDSDGWLLGVQNGVVDLRTGRVRDADPRDLMMLQCPVAWDPDAEAPRWDQAMREWFPDPEVRSYVQRVAGSALLGAQRDHVFVIHYGGGRNGKGTFVRALQKVLGPYMRVIHLSLLVEQKYSQHDTVRAELFRVRLAVASETQRRVRLDEASVKNLSGGDRITARRMREDLWEFDPTHSLWLQTNHLPEISGRDRGIWSRIRVVKWEATFEGSDQDDRLGDRLASEAPGILRWLVDGCLEWQTDGLAEPEAVVRDTLAYRDAEDTFSRFQKDTGLVFNPGLTVIAGELQDLLAEWAQAEGMDPPRQDVGEWLREHGCRQKQRRVKGADGKSVRRRFWLGVGLKDGEHTDD